MQACNRGVANPAAKAVAQSEGLPIKRIVSGIARGTIAIPHNSSRPLLHAVGIGAGLRVKINANLGCSPGFLDLETELRKARTAVELGADALMDLSTTTKQLRRKLLQLPVPLGTVPVYDVLAKKGANASSDDFFDAVREHCRDGMDFVTVHCAVNKKNLAVLKKSDRVLGIVSRGGSALASWVHTTGNENPFFAEYDYLLEILAENDVTISLGDGFRPGCLHDANDAAQEAELRTNATLVKRARLAGVQSIVEGPGHMPLNTIAAHVKHMKKLCGGAPYYVLGPLVSDVGAGHDHLTAAIGGAIAATAGADFLCYVTPSEHLAIPDEADVREGVIGTKIAALAADAARGNKAAIARNLEMGKARAALDWSKQFRLALDQLVCKKFRACRPPKPGEASDACSMCGEYCAIKVYNSTKKK
ncbi:MAG: phosphomethylpyrimidine synthase ThiC [Candidatus Micrarchaeia archaeon]|jgi:phosphomethylpyrimidine synthase